MTNDEIQMSKEVRMTKHETRHVRRFIICCGARYHGFAWYPWPLLGPAGDEQLGPGLVHGSLPDGQRFGRVSRLI